MIRLEDVSKRYPNGTAALQDVDLTIDQGDFAFLVGSSGAGKSTLIRLLIREELPTTGRVVVDGRDVARLRRSQIPNLRLNDNNDLAVEVHQVSPSSSDLVFDAELILWDDFDTSSFYSVDGIPRFGWWRFSDAGADEPTGNLDPVTSWEIIKLLTRVQELGTTLVMATHNAEIVNALRRRVIHLDHGAVVRDEREGLYAA